MFEARFASRKLLVLGSVFAIGVMISGCSKNDSDSSCHDVFAAGILSQSCHGNRPVSSTLSNLQESDSAPNAETSANKIQVSSDSDRASRRNLNLLNQLEYLGRWERAHDRDGSQELKLLKRLKQEGGQFY